MKQPTFLEGVSVAIATSLAGSVLYTALDVVFPGAPVLRLLIAGIGLAYVVYLLSRSPERAGASGRRTGAIWSGFSLREVGSKPPLHHHQMYR